MQQSTPKPITWWVALLLGILANWVTLPLLNALAFWLVVLGVVLLQLATRIEGL